MEPPAPAPDESRPALVAVGHGTRSPAGRRALAALRLEVAGLRPELEVLTASVDVQRPSLPDAVAALAARRRCAVVVPMLLSAGYHVYVDVAEAVASAPDRLVAAAALGPDPVLVELLDARLTVAGAFTDDAVVLAAAGSSDPRALADVEHTARALRGRRGGAVTVGYAASGRPTVAEAVALARDEGARRVAVATYLLAPGVFADRLGDAGADVVSAPLAPDPLLAELILTRYDAALEAAPQLLPADAQRGGPATTLRNG
jgi:sirohydrochlorin ferrochelatase